MSLSGIGTGVGSSVFLNGTSLQAQQAAAVRHGSAGGLANDTVSLSGSGQFISQLQALKASDPQKFKEVLAQTISQLQAAARQEGNTARGQSLNELARKLQNVANGGDIAQLKPATYANRVQRAYGSHQAEGVQEVLNSLGRGGPAPSGPDPHYVLKSATLNLHKV
jgi:hypothetical protein